MAHYIKPIGPSEYVQFSGLFDKRKYYNLTEDKLLFKVMSA